MDEFFQKHAGQNQERGSSRTWVMRWPEDEPELPRVLGFYTLSLGSLERASLEAHVPRGLPRYPVPVVIMGRLATHLQVRGRGYGERLLLDAHHRILEVSKHVGGIAVVVDAKDLSASRFYTKYGYEDLERTAEEHWPRRMILLIEVIRRANEQLITQ